MKFSNSSKCMEKDSEVILGIPGTSRLDAYSMSPGMILAKIDWFSESETNKS